MKHIRFSSQKTLNTENKYDENIKQHFMDKQIQDAFSLNYYSTKFFIDYSILTKLTAIRNELGNDRNHAESATKNGPGGDSRGL